MTLFRPPSPSAVRRRPARRRVDRPAAVPGRPVSLAVALSVALACALTWTPLLAAPSGAQASALENPFATLPREYGDALVTLRFVSKVQMPGVDTEVDQEIVCLAIEPRGLLLCSQALLGGSFDVMARLMGGSSAPIRTQPREIEVLLPDGGPVLAATVIARDSDRDLAWLELVDLPPERALRTLDFGRSAEPAVGAPFYLLRRLPRFFGSTAVVSPGTVAAVIDEPRRLVVPGAPGGFLGVPAFAPDGSLLGLTVAQVPASDESRAFMGRGSRPLPGQAGPADDMVAGMILPAADVVRATQLALEVRAADAAEALE